MSANEPPMPPVQRAAVNGIEMAFFEVGPRKGHPVIFCHGFPEIAYSWRHQLDAFAAAGRWAIAPDQRGFGQSSRPEAVEAYDMEHLTGDLVGLMDALGVEKAILCGHDWGGMVVWQMPLMHPQRVAGVIGLNTPLFRRGAVDPVEALRKAYGDETYIVSFQAPGVVDELFARDVEKALRFIIRGPGSVVDGVNPQAAGGSRHGFGALLRAYDPSTDDTQFLSEEAMKAYVGAFMRTGFTGGLNWYRNLSRNWRRSADLPTRIDGVPCLMIMAELDDVLTPSLAQGMEYAIDNLDKVLLPGVGHWTQQEAPDLVNRVLLDWIEKHFPSGVAGGRLASAPPHRPPR